MFKNLRYKSCNQSIHILRGHVTFRFWIPKVRDTSQNSNDVLPCRFKIRLDGFEWFIYNRVEAYEFLRSMLEPDGSSPTRRHSSGEERNGSRDSFASLDFRTDAPNNSMKSSAGGITRFLPVEFVGKKGSIVVGNQDIPTLIILHYKEFVGEYTVGKARSQIDPESSHFKASFSSAKIILTRNFDYREPLLNQAARLRAQRIRRRRGIGRLFNFLKSARSDFDDGISSTQFEWLGLARYNVTNDPLQKKLAAEEYARSETLLEAESLKVFYVSDIPGIQPLDTESEDLPPRWGLEMKTKNGSLNYGPWTARQRLVSQDFFFPTSFRSYTKSERPRPGQRRRCQYFDFALLFEGSTMIRIPFREPSKDWKYGFNEEDVPAKPKTGARPCGWLDFKTNSLADIRFAIPIEANENGYKTLLNIDFADVAVSSSLNFSTFLRSQRLQVSGNLNSPLMWNAERTWDFRISMNKSRIFLLRDHITLFQDLASDFSSGPPTEEVYFIPIVYYITGALKETELSLCTNYNNVIYQPNDPDENSLLVTKVEDLAFSVDLPFLAFKPPGYEVKFDVKAHSVEVLLGFPKASTFGVFTKEKDRRIGIVQDASVSGSYRFNSIVESGALDQITCDVEGIYNMLQFILNVKVENAVAVIPENLYSCKEVLVARITSATVKSKSTEFFYVTGGPLTLGQTKNFDGDFKSLLTNKIETPESKLYVDCEKSLELVFINVI
ncbi:hypothetical protein HDU97_010313 [Phlyctochytrium planicorne]|nr:hypothetical protein HDU97_010313 [Phlyctochytrium planicorne]